MRLRITLSAAALALGAPICAPTAHAQSTAPATQPAPTSAAALTPEQLDALVAPIALYPDALVIQIVQCAASPFQVNAVSQWLSQNPDLKGTAAQEAAVQQGFDANFVAIVLFPQVVQMMAQQPDWTRQLGQAFTTDRDGVLESVQRLRAQAQAAGNLQTTSQQSVTTVPADGGQQVIVIQPANPQVVYVPQYDPQVVYVEKESDSSDASVGAAALIGFAAGVIVGAALDDDDDEYYYAYGGWGYGGGVCYSGGYNNFYNHRENMANDYYDHRENMANDYYDHRENMAGQRGDNQGNRQDSRSENQGNRQDARGGAQDSAAQNQTARQDTRSQTRNTAGETRGANQTTRQTAASGARTTQTAGSRAWQAPAQTNRGASATQRSTANRGQATSRTTSRNSGAFSGYQRGSTERASSSRGRSSMGSRSGGASRGGGGGGRGGRR